MILAGPVLTGYLTVRCLDFCVKGAYALNVDRAKMQRGSTPEDVMATCALFHSRRAARAMTAHFDKYLKLAGIKATQYSLLVAVSLAEQRPLSEIAAYMAMDRTALARDLRVLEKRGLLTIASPEGDRRVRQMTLTAKGTRVMHEALPHWRKAQDGVERAMDRGSWPRVLAGLQIASNLN